MSSLFTGLFSPLSVGHILGREDGRGLGGEGERGGGRGWAGVMEGESNETNEGVMATAAARGGASRTQIHTRSPDARTQNDKHRAFQSGSKCSLCRSDRS